MDPREFEKKTQDELDDILNRFVSCIIPLILYMGCFVGFVVGGCEFSGCISGGNTACFENLDYFRWCIRTIQIDSSIKVVALGMLLLYVGALVFVVW